VEEYFHFDPARENALRELDAVIRAAAPALSRWFVPGTPPGQPGMTMTMIGYGQYWYTIKSSPAPLTWPILGIALQKNYLSFYCNAYGDDAPFACAYTGQLGHAGVSAKGVVSFARIDDINLQALAEMVTAVEAGLESGQLVARLGPIPERGSGPGGLRHARALARQLATSISTGRYRPTTLRREFHCGPTCQETRDPVKDLLGAAGRGPIDADAQVDERRTSHRLL
jgi:hypothetical protein